MERINVEPRTPDWHAYRSESLTASMAATLVASKNATLLRDYAARKGVILDIEPLLAVGIDNFFDNTLWTVWAQKNGRIPQVKGTNHTTRGPCFEEVIVRALEKHELMTVERMVTAVSSDYRGLMASLDALAPQSSDRTVLAPFGFPVEAKNPAFVSRKKLWEVRKKGGLAIMGLPHYWCQIQHQIFVTQAPYGWFVAAGVAEAADPVTGKANVFKSGYSAEFLIVEKVPRDDKFLEAYVAAAKFYHAEFIETYIEPPKLPSDENLIDALAAAGTFDLAIMSGDTDLAVDLYLASVEAEILAKQRREDLEEKVLAVAGKLRAEGATDSVLLANRLQIDYIPPGTTTSWQKVSQELAKAAGLPDIPKGVLDSCQINKKESIKLKEVA